MRKLPIVCVTSAALVSLVWADSVTLNPTRDNTLIQTSDGSLSNALGDIYVGRTNQPDTTSRRRGVVHFNVAGSVPAGSTITSVTLRLWLARTSDTSTRTIGVHKATASWGEGTSYYNGGTGSASTTNDATWKHRLYSGTNWATLGGSYNATASASTSVGSSASVGTWYSWSSATLTSDVQGWLTTPSSNHGWVLIGVESTAHTARRFTSREATDDTGDHFPELIINYTPPGGLAAEAAPARAESQAQAVVGGMRLLGERDLDSDGDDDLLLRGAGGALFGGRETPTGLVTWPLALERASRDPLAVPAP